MLTYTVEISCDGGKTWQFDCSITLAGGPWYEQDGKTVTASSWASVTVDAPGALLRGKLVTHQTCDIGSTIEASP